MLNLKSAVLGPRLFFLFPEIADGLLEPGLEVGMAAPAADFLEDEFGRLGLIAQRAVGLPGGALGVEVALG